MEEQKEKVVKVQPTTKETERVWLRVARQLKAIEK